MSDETKASTPTDRVEEVKQKEYEVTLILSEKYWNDDIKRYLFAYNRDGVVSVGETEEITFVTTELWRISDMLYSGEIEQVRIKLVK